MCSKTVYIDLFVYLLIQFVPDYSFELGLISIFPNEQFSPPRQDSSLENRPNSFYRAIELTRVGRYEFYLTEIVHQDSCFLASVCCQVIKYQDRLFVAWLSDNLLL